MEQGSDEELQLAEDLEKFKHNVDIKAKQFPQHIPDNIIAMLQDIKQLGRTSVKWDLILPVIATLIHLECYKFYQKYGFIGPLPQTFGGRYLSLFLLLESFQRPPWTLQRLVELLLQPQQTYSATHKFMNSLEKLLSVTGTLDQLE